MFDSPTLSVLNRYHLSMFPALRQDAADRQPRPLRATASGSGAALVGTKRAGDAGAGVEAPRGKYLSQMNVKELMAVALDEGIELEGAKKKAEPSWRRCGSQRSCGTRTPP